MYATGWNYGVTRKVLERQKESESAARYFISTRKEDRLTYFRGFKFRLYPDDFFDYTESEIIVSGNKEDLNEQEINEKLVYLY